MLLLALACAPESANPLDVLSPSPLGVDAPVPDFELADVNESSASFETLLGPSQYLDRTSAWYFGHAT